MRRVTNSEQRTFRRCPREHYYAYACCIRPLGTAGPLRFGSLIHEALEVYWRAWQRCPTSLNSALDAALLVANAKAFDAYDAAKATALIVGYHARWRLEPLEVLAVELEFDAPLINPATGYASNTYTLAGKLDALARNTDDGKLYIVEHKTTSDDIGAGSVYWRRLTLDAQVSTYYAGAKSLGHDVAGCIYDVIGKPRLQPYTATPVEARKYKKKTGELYANQHERDEPADDYQARILSDIEARPERYYQRGTVVRFEHEQREAAFDTWQTTRLIREAELANRYPRNSDACPRFGRMCSYFDVCTGVANLDDTTRYRKADNPHEELSNADADNT